MIDDATRGRADAGAPTMDGDTTSATTAPAETRDDETIVPSWGGGSAISLPDPGYQLGTLIGRGGMGEVVVAQDQRIGREVAVKRIRSKSPTHDAVTRFLREARIQARLDHPAIVPVYELGVEADGRPFFTMKRLTGVTLQRKIADRAQIQPMLRAFVDVCLAIQLAHARGVVHRDLKPSNIMLGDYGEVYVLDWGVARVLTDRRRTTRPQMAVDVDEDTTAGAILGTPGYMSPEQIRGSEVGPAADVYSLGAMLFEILAGEPLHPRGDAALATTLSHPQIAPAQRAVDRTIPPELDAACFDALAEEPARRPTARELADRVQAYLDGDRDIERRREIAAEQLSSARDALEHGGPDARATAMRRAGRALALDPKSVEAAELVTSLMLEPPKELPPDLVASLAEADRTANRERSRATMYTFLSLFAFWAVLPLLDIKSWPNLVAFYGLMALGVVIARRTAVTGETHLPVTLVLMTMIVLAFSRILGPFVLTPIVACATLISATAIPSLANRRVLFTVWSVIAMVLPLVLEWTGAVRPTYDIGGGYLLSTSDIFGMRGAPIDRITLIVANVLFVVITGLVALAINGRRREAQQQLAIQAWHLRQLLPTAGKAWATKVKK